MEWNADAQRSQPGLSRAALVKPRGAWLLPFPGGLRLLHGSPRAPRENHHPGDARTQKRMHVWIFETRLSFQVVRVQTPFVFAWMGERGSLGPWVFLPQGGGGQ